MYKSEILINISSISISEEAEDTDVADVAEEIGTDEENDVFSFSFSFYFSFSVVWETMGARYMPLLILGFLSLDSLLILF